MAEDIEPPSKDLKELGKTARARFEDVRMKRREIVRIDTLPPEETNKAASNKQRKKNVAHSNKLKSTETHTRPATKRRKRDQTDPRIDSWLPDVSHMPTCTKDNRSTVVQLHGLPTGCTVEQIRRFFTGLEPERIFFLPKNETCIPSLDASNRRLATINNRGHAATAVVDRHGNQFRVFTKFASSPTAALATERSGEAITLPEHSSISCSSSSSSFTGATIAVTPLVKRTASRLLGTMVSKTYGLLP
jgi:hypothetical protein